MYHIKLIENGICITTLQNAIVVPAGVGHWTWQGVKVFYRDAHYSKEIAINEIQSITDETQTPAVLIPNASFANSPTALDLFAILRPFTTLKFTGANSNPNPSTDMTMIIPTPIVKIDRSGAGEMIQVKWDSNNTPFLQEPNSNKFIFLFAYKKSKKVQYYDANRNKITEKIGKKWTHPTHLDGSHHAGKSKYAGKPNYEIYALGNQNLQDYKVVSPLEYFHKPTEFALGNRDAWQSIDIKPNRYFFVRENISGTIVFLEDALQNPNYVNNLPQEILTMLGSNKITFRTKNNIRSELLFKNFKLAIAVKKNDEYFFSDFSQEFSLSKLKIEVGENQYKYKLK